MSILPLPSDQDASGRTLGAEELVRLSEAITSGTLTSTKGSMVAEFERRFAALHGVAHAIACASGSAAVHCAVAAIDAEPGGEVVTTSVTDMGALAPILYQGAIPVFADVDERTGNVTAQTLERRCTERTAAIIATHLFGNPCDMASIRELGDRLGVPVIEDAAQAFLAETDGRLAGTTADIGCFSLQQGKHITTGEGGVVITDDDAIARRVRLFVNKAWPYGEPNPDHEFLALNYRMNELTGAVALAQLAKLEEVVTARRATASALSDRLTGVDAIDLPRVVPGAASSWWKYAPIVEDHVPGGAVALAAALRDRGIASAPRYIQKPAFQCRVFTERRTFGRSQWPFTLAEPSALDWDPARFPGTFAFLERVLVLPWNERYTEAHVDYIARSVLDGLAEVRRAGAAA
jgi:dTDP-4-amino-4,6-dideoxygalactose transaminase